MTGLLPETADEATERREKQHGRGGLNCLLSLAPSVYPLVHSLLRGLVLVSLGEKKAGNIWTKAEGNTRKEGRMRR